MKANVVVPGPSHPIPPDDPDQDFYTSGELLALPPELTNFYLEPFVPTESVVMLFGKPGSFKTTVMVNMAKAISRGVPLWGLTTDKQARVLVVELDTPRKIFKTRFGPLLEDDLPVDFYFRNGQIDLVDRKTDWDTKIWERLHALHIQNQYGVVFIDTLYMMHTRDMLLGESVAPVYAALRRLFHGATVVVLHHSRKSPKDQFSEVEAEGFSGSIQWAAQAQVVIRAAIADRDEHVMTLGVTKSQVSEMGKPLKLVIHGPLVTLESDAKAVELEAALSSLAPGLSKGQIDTELARILGLSTVQAKRRRLTWEKTQLRSGSLVTFPMIQQQTTEPQRT